MKEELKIFTYELNQIKDPKIKEFTIKALEVLPDYFWSIPASSTGKYHPSYTVQSGGLCQHVKGAVRIALELFNLEMFKFNQEQKDIIIYALLLHDGVKSGIVKSQYTVHEHPLMIREFLKLHKETYKGLDDNILETILRGIESHMGQWQTNKFSKVVLPKPESGIQKFIHMCDYLASRKCIDMNFETVE
jgi:hypothetical protein